MFHKFPKIQNYESLTERELLDFKSPVGHYLVTEKVDGSNCSVTFDLDNQDIQVYTRNGNPFSPDLINVVMPSFDRLLDLLLTVKIRDSHTLLGQLLSDAREVVLAGELFGSRVMNRIDYGRAVDFTAFSLSFYGKQTVIVPARSIDWLFDDAEINMVPALFISTQDLTVVPKYCTMGVPSMYANPNPKKKERTFVEGYVIYSLGSDFGIDTLRYMAKLKDENFKDVASAKAIKRDDEVTTLNKEFNLYFTENRVLDTISKFGGSITKKQIGEVMTSVIHDAMDSFKSDKESEIEKLKRSLEKQIFKVSPSSVDMIRKAVKDQVKE